MSALAAYYTAMANDRNAAADLARAQISQTNTQTAQIGDDSFAKRQSLAASTFAANEQAKSIAPSTASEIAQRAAQTNATNISSSFLGPQFDLDAAAKTASTQAQRISNNIQGNPFDTTTSKLIAGQLPGNSFGPIFDAVNRFLGRTPQPATTLSTPIMPSYTTKSVLDPQYARPAGFSKGGIVKKAGNPKPGKEDTIAAKLAPGEAVLNAGAVRHIGHSTIHHLNKMGLLRSAAEAEVHGHFKALRDHNLAKVTAEHRKQAGRAGRSKARA